MSRARGRAATLLLAVAAVVGVVASGGVALAPSAAAHARVVGIEPGSGSSVATPPEQVVVRFSEPVRPPVTVLVTAGDGRSAAAAPARLAGSTLTQAVRPDAAPGRWSVAVRVVGDDGHPVVATARFTVGAAGAAGDTTADDGPGPSPGAIAVGLLLLVAGAALALRSRPASPGARAAAPAVAACLVGAGTLVVALAAAGGGPQPVVPGLPDAGPLVGWARPVLRLAVDGALVVAFGLLVGAAWLVRTPGRPAGDEPHPATLPDRVPAADVSLAGWVAALGAAAVALQVWVTASDIRGTGLAGGASPDDLVAFVTGDPQGRALGVQLALVVAVAVLGAGVANGRAGVPRRSAAGLAVLAGGALLPPLLVGHLTGTGGPGLTPTVLAVHVLAAATWVGGLVALVRAALVVGVDGMRASLPVWSRLALGCALAVGLTGVVNLALRLDGPAGLATGYGALAGLKLGAFAALVVVGWLQRRRVAAVLGDAPPTRAAALRAVIRLAAAETLLMAATFGVAAALTRTPSPPRVVDPETGVTAAVLGYPAPAEASPLRLLTGVLPDGPALVVLALLVTWFVRHVRRHRPERGQVVAGVLGLVVLAWATVGGLGVYSRVGLPAHVTAHLLVAVVVPVLLLRGGLEDALRARGVPRLPAPAAAALLAVVAAGPYLPGVLEEAMALPGGAWLLLATGLAGGVLALRGEPMAVLAAGAVACGVLSWWLVGTATLVGLDWFSGFSVPYLRNFGDDQRRAGFLVWFAGGLPLLVLLASRVLRPTSNAVRFRNSTSSERMTPTP